MSGRSCFVRTCKTSFGSAAFVSLVSLASLVAVSSASPAFAQEDPRKAQSTPLFEEGLRLADKGRHVEALDKFRKAYAAYPSPNTLFNVARTEQLMGLNLEAIRDYREALRNPVLNPQMGEQAKKFIADLEKTLGRVMVVGPSGAKVSINGNEYRLPLDHAVDVDPGTVLARADIDGKPVETSAVAAAGKVVTIDLKGSSSSPATPAPAGTAVGASGASNAFTEPPKEGEKSFWDSGRIAGIAAIGVGLVGIGVGVGFGASSNSKADKADELQKQLGPSGCSGAGAAAQCAELNDARDSQDSLKTMSTVFVVSGAVIGAAGAALVLWPRTESVRVAPSAGRNGAGLVLSGSF